MTKRRRDENKIKPAPNETESVKKPTVREIDRELVRLLNERSAQTYADDVHRKRRMADSKRIESDSKAIAAAVRANKGPLPNLVVEYIFRELTAAARDLSREIRVAYLGPEYTYSYLAATRHFGASTDLCPVATIAAVFDEVDQEQVNFGVVPLENSTDGRVADTLENFVRLPLKICGEVKLRINHCLLARCSRSEIHTVYSKPQAMSQCRGWLAKHLPKAQLLEMASTTAAAKLAAEESGVAAIASREAGIQNELNVVDANIQDNASNVTRFAVIGREDLEPSETDKTAFLFGIPHEPGALADLMNIFKRNHLNMTWIESFPDPKAQDAYLFFVEADGHQSDSAMQRAIQTLSRKASRLEILGSFPRTEPVD